MESDGLAWLLQVNDLLGNEKLGVWGEIDWNLSFSVRDVFESLNDRSELLVSEEVGCDLGLASLIVEKDRRWGVACVGQR